MIAFIVGALCPFFHHLSFLIPYAVGVMLCITFLGMDARRLRPQKRHFAIIAANICIGLLPCLLLRSLGQLELAEAAFFAGITGEAASAPVIVRMLGGRSEFAATGLVLNSLSASIVIPLLAPFVLSRGHGDISQIDIFLAVLREVCAMLLAPCAIAFLLRRFYPASRQWSERLSFTSLMIWLSCMIVVAASGVYRVQSSGASLREILPYAAVVLCLCISGFSIGRRIGGQQLPMECGQCLGQKNATVGIYLAMCYSAPLVFLGPAIYLFFHHIYSTYQMLRYQHSLQVEEQAREA